MKNATHNLPLSFIGILVKVYILVGIVWASVAQ